MTISVIIPTFNEAQHIAETVRHLQQPGLDEVVIVDGGSQDVTITRAAQVAPSARIMSAPKGRARQMNVGAAVAKGEILLFLHADTLLPRTAGTDIVSAMIDPVTVGGRFDVRMDEDTGLYWVIARLMSWRSRLTGITTGDQALFVRRTVFDALGGFPELPIMEDVAFSKRLKRAGRTVALRSVVVTSHRRWSQHGLLRTILLMWSMRVLFFFGVTPERLKQWYPDTR